MSETQLRLFKHSASTFLTKQPKHETFQNCSTNNASKQVFEQGLQPWEAFENISIKHTKHKMIGNKKNRFSSINHTQEN